MEERKHNEFFPMRTAVEQEQGLLNLLAYTGQFFDLKELTMIEIGSYIGESTMLFAKRFNFVFSIDPFIDDYPENYGVSRYAEFDKVYAKFLENTKDFRNIWHVKQKSDNAASIFTSRKVDFVYIDGCHTSTIISELRNKLLNDRIDYTDRGSSETV